MNPNIAANTVGTLLWDGAESSMMDIRHYRNFAFSFEATAELAEDAVFILEYSAASEADPCVPDGDWQPVPEVPTCAGMIESEEAQMILPAGTAEGAICGGTIPCRPGAFIRIVGSSGPVADVNVVGLRQGPR